MTTFRDYYVGMTFGRFDKLHVHWPDCGDVLLNNRLNGPTPLRNVTPQTTNEANVVRRIDKNFNIQLLEQAGVGKNQNAFNDHDWLRLDGARFV
jgi:hypothetical protein